MCTHQFEASLTLPSYIFIDFYLLLICSTAAYRISWLRTRMWHMDVDDSIIIIIIIIIHLIIIASIALEWELNSDTTGMCGSTPLECGAPECAANFFSVASCVL